MEGELTRLRDALQRLEAKYAQEQQQRRTLQEQVTAAGSRQQELAAERDSLQQDLDKAAARCGAVSCDRVRLLARGHMHAHCHVRVGLA